MDGKEIEILNALVWINAGRTTQSGVADVKIREANELLAKYIQKLLEEK